MLNEDVLKEFIFECELRKLSKRTIRSYRNVNLRMMKFIQNEYGITELENTPHLAIKGYIQYQTGQGRAESYINRKKEKEELLKVGKYNSKFNDILGLDIENMDIYRSKGLPSHIVKRKHYKCLKYIDYIPDIISEPDYIGVNSNEEGTRIELIKRYADNVMIGIKLDTDEEYLYVSTYARCSGIKNIKTIA